MGCALAIERSRCPNWTHCINARISDPWYVPFTGYPGRVASRKFHALSLSRDDPCGSCSVLYSNITVVVGFATLLVLVVLVVFSACLSLLLRGFCFHSFVFIKSYVCGIYVALHLFLLFVFPAHPLANTVRIRICICRWLNRFLKCMRKGRRCLDKPLVDDEQDV